MPNWFTVNGRPFAGGDSLEDRAALGQLAPLALAIALPVAVVVAALLAACLLWQRRQLRRGESFLGRANPAGAYSESLAAAVAAARKGDASSAAALLLGGDAAGGGGLDRLANDWQISPSSIEICKDAEGNEIVLGTGAAGKVFKGTFNGVQEVAVKVFNEPLAALAAAAASAPKTPKPKPAPAPAPPALARASWMPWRKSADGRGGGEGVSAPCPPPRLRSLKHSPSSADADPPAPTPHPASLAAARQLEELGREVLLMRACRDRNLVPFVGACVQGGHAVIVSELMHNGDLYTALAGDAGRRFGWRPSLDAGGRPRPNTGLNRRVALDVARGLAHLHSRGVVHLDVKSPNVLLSRDWTAKLADYGRSGERERRGARAGRRLARSPPTTLPPPSCRHQQGHPRQVRVHPARRGRHPVLGRAGSLARPPRRRQGRRLLIWRAAVGAVGPGGAPIKVFEAAECAG